MNWKLTKKRIFFGLNLFFFLIFLYKILGNRKKIKDALSANDSINYNSQLAKKAGLMRQTVSQKEVSSSFLKTNYSGELVYEEDPFKSYENGQK